VFCLCVYFKALFFLYLAWPYKVVGYYTLFHKRVNRFRANRKSRRTVPDPSCDGYAFCDWRTVIVDRRRPSGASVKTLTDVRIVVGILGKNMFWSAEWFTLMWNRVYNWTFFSFVSFFNFLMPINSSKRVVIFWNYYCW